MAKGYAIVDGQIRLVPVSKFDEDPELVPATEQDLEEASVMGWFHNDGRTFETSVFDGRIMGYEPATAAQVQAQIDLEESMEDRGLMTALEAGGSMISFGAIPWMERLVGAGAGAVGDLVDSDYLRDLGADLGPAAQAARRKVRPGADLAGTLIGAFSPTGLVKGVVGGAGKLASMAPVIGRFAPGISRSVNAGLSRSPAALVMDKTAKTIAGRPGVAGKVAAGMAAGAAEGALFGTGEVVEAMALERPVDVADALTTSVGMGLVLGGGIELAAPAAGAVYRKVMKEPAGKVREAWLGKYLPKRAKEIAEKGRKIDPNMTPEAFKGATAEQLDNLQRYLRRLEETGEPVDSDEIAGVANLLLQELDTSARTVEDVLRAGDDEVLRAYEKAQSAKITTLADDIERSKLALDQAQASGQGVKEARASLKRAEESMADALREQERVTEEGLGWLDQAMRDGVAPRYQTASKDASSQAARRLDQVFDLAKGKIDDALGKAPVTERTQALRRLLDEAPKRIGEAKNTRDRYEVVRALHDKVFEARADLFRAGDGVADDILKDLDLVSPDNILVMTKRGGAEFRRFNDYYNWKVGKLEELGAEEFAKQYDDLYREFLLNHPDLPKMKKLGEAPAEMAPAGTPDSAFRETADGRRVVDLDKALDANAELADELVDAVNPIRRKFFKAHHPREGGVLYEPKSNIKRYFQDPTNPINTADEIETLKNMALDDVNALKAAEERALSLLPPGRAASEPAGKLGERLQELQGLVRVQREIRPRGIDKVEAVRQIAGTATMGAAMGSTLMTTAGLGLGAYRAQKLYKDPAKALQFLVSVERAIKRNGERINSIAENVLRPAARSASRAAATAGVLESDFKKNRDMVVKNRNPMTFMRNVSQATTPAADSMPLVADAMTMQAVKAQKFLSDRVPTGPRMPDGTEGLPSPSDMRKFNAYVAAVNKPLDAIDPSAGYLSPEAIEVLTDVYPEVLAQIQFALLERVIEEQANGRAIPYKRRPMVAELTGVDIDGRVAAAAAHDARVMNKQMQGMQQGGMQAGQPTSQAPQVAPAAMSASDRAAQRELD